ncbi:MAG: hypothetical protein R3E08_07360 [Thiotrichaceae bacterium]
MLNTKDIEEFRSDLINRFIPWLGIASLVEMAILMLHIPRLGWLPYFILRFCIIIGIWILVIFRYRLSYTWRVGLLMGSVWISVTAHML